ncbi:MAG: CHASE2 domain-containing protein [Gammaproteobacteria bacterium]
MRCPEQVRTAQILLPVHVPVDGSKGSDMSTIGNVRSRLENSAPPNRLLVNFSSIAPRNARPLSWGSTTNQTGTILGLSTSPREWPRSVHARLIERLLEQRASVIVFDFDFEGPILREDDLAFAKVCPAKSTT